MKIEIPDLTGSECGDIAVTAAEGGIGYWSQIESYDPERWWPGTHYGPTNVPDDFVFFRLAPLNDDESGYDWDAAVDITPVLLRRGIEIALTEARHDLVRDIILNRAREDWDFDADGADVIVQCGVYGKIVWG